MHRQHRLLRFGLHRHRLARLLHGEPDRSGIRRITLVADIERFDKSGLQEPDLVTLLAQLTRPMVRTAARFHANEARRTIGEEFQKIRSLDRLVDDFTRFPIDVMHLKHILGDIHAYRGKIHLGLSGYL